MVNRFNTLIENSKQAVHYWWLLLLTGLVLFLLGIATFLFPEQSYIGMSILFGWVILITGILEVVLSSANRHFVTGRGWMLAGGVIEIVQHDPDGDPVPLGELPHQVERLDLVAQVEVVGGLVQQHDRRVLGEAGGEPDPLHLAAGELPGGTVGEVADAGQAHGVVDRGAVGVVEAGEAAPVRVAAEGDHVADGEPLRGGAGLGEQRQRPCELLRAEQIDAALPRRAGEADAALLPRVEAGQRTQHRGFPAPVGAQQRRDPPGLQREGDLVDDALRAVAQRELLAGEGGTGVGLGVQHEGSLTSPNSARPLLHIS